MEKKWLAAENSNVSRFWGLFSGQDIDNLNINQFFKRKPLPAAKRLAIKTLKMVLSIILNKSDQYLLEKINLFFRLLRVCPENSPKNGSVVSRYFLFIFWKLDLSRRNHTNFDNEIRIVSAICALITRWLRFVPPPSPVKIQ